MLNNIPSVISPELMVILMEMGHGDEIVLADANFPAHTIAKSTVSGKAAHCEGAGVPEMLDAILTLMPLDYAVEHPVTGMAAPAELGGQPIHREFARILQKHGYVPEKTQMLARMPFYERAKYTYAVLITGETARFANIILKKGVVRTEK